MTTYCHNCMNPIDEHTGVCPHCGQTPFGVNPVHQLKAGTLLKNRYLIGKSLGQGGFGITYIGVDTTLDLRVAIKEYYPNGISNRNHEVTDDVTLTASSADLFQKGKLRFLQEAKTLARFYTEPGIVSVHDFFEANNTAYIVMEYLDGITLKRFVETRGKIPADSLIRAMRPIMQSLGRVHAQKVIHRDISPDNIMVLRNGTLKLLDFGAAREVGGDKSLSVMLKPGYAPEEQYRSRGKQGPWTDIYALCATMYFCLTGVRPEESVERAMNPDNILKRPSELGASITPAQESVLLRGMAVRAADRYQSMEELAAALKSLVSTVTEPPVPPEPVEPTPEAAPNKGPDPAPTPKPVKQRPKLNHLIPVLFGLLAVGLIYGRLKVFWAREQSAVISNPAPTVIAESSIPVPTTQAISTNPPAQTVADKFIRNEIGSGTIRSETGVPLNIRAEWTAYTLDENNICVLVETYLESYSIMTIAASNVLNVNVGGSYVSADVPAINIDDNTYAHSSLLAKTEHVLSLPYGGSTSFDVTVDYIFHGVYFGIELPTISCYGTITLSQSGKELQVINDNDLARNTAVPTPTPPPAPESTEDPNIPHLSIEDATYPEDMTQGSVACLLGKICTDKGVIVQVCGRIVDADGYVVQKCIFFPYENTFSLAATVNSELVFGLLEPGRYTYVVSAIAEYNSYTNGEEILIEHPFEIYYP